MACDSDRCEALCVTTCVVVIVGALFVLTFRGCSQSHLEDMKHIERGDMRFGQSWVPAEVVRK